MEKSLEWLKNSFMRTTSVEMKGGEERSFRRCSTSVSKIEMNDLISVSIVTKYKTSGNFSRHIRLLAISVANSIADWRRIDLNP